MLRLSHERQGISLFKYCTSTNTICLPHVIWLVHDVPARLVLKKKLTLALGMVGGFSRLMTDPAKDPSTYLSPTNIPMMANYPPYAAMWHTSTTSGNQYRQCGGGGRGMARLCGTRRLCSHFLQWYHKGFQISAFIVQPFVLQRSAFKQWSASQDPGGNQRGVYYPG